MDAPEPVCWAAALHTRRRLLYLRAVQVERTQIQRVYGVQHRGPLRHTIFLGKHVGAPGMEWTARHANGVATTRGGQAQPARCTLAVARIVERAPQAAHPGARHCLRLAAHGAHVVRDACEDPFVRFVS
jgi:hypothetical protein